MLCAVWFLPVKFTACSKDDWWCAIAYWLTESAGKWGTLFIVVTASFFYTFRVSLIVEKMKVFGKSIFSIVALLGIVAFFNEHVLKELLEVARPSHTFIIEQSGIDNGLDSLYQLNEEGRTLFLSHAIDTHQAIFSHFDSNVLSHWIDEVGYSFPSGHSCNAFLLAYILGYSMFHSRNKKVQLFYALPFVWAIMVGISRVAIGAHSALDVSIGAAIGLLVAASFLYFTGTKKLIHP